MKRFLEWLGLKEKLDEATHRPPFVKEGDIWWVSMGENVGSEVSGKNDAFSRPAIVLKKLSHAFYLVIPTTTQEREGSWYVRFRQKDKEMRACLHQMRAIDHRRVLHKLGTLDDEDFVRVKEGLWSLLER